MKLNDGFALKYIAGVPYILPFGQSIADFKRGIRIDNTGVLIWKLMHEHDDCNGLLKALAEHFSANESETEEISGDLKRFISQLMSFGIVSDDSVGQDDCGNYVRTLKIGGLYIDLFGDSRVYSPNFDSFTASRQEHADFTVCTHIGSPRINENGRVLLRNISLCVMECDTGYILTYPDKKGIIQANLKKDGTRVDFYINPGITAALTEDMFHAIRPAFLYTAQKKGMFAMHSASILYNGKAWLFSGHSGMGKSTHTNLWNSIYGTPIANGDLNMMAIEDGRAFVHGIPWCGTSNICDANTYPLGGIVLLGRSDTDTIETLPAHENALLVMQRLISPSWDEEKLSQNIDFSSRLASLVPVCRLKCTKNPSAAERMKAWIDAAVNSAVNAED